MKTIVAAFAATALLSAAALAQTPLAAPAAPARAGAPAAPVALTPETTAALAKGATLTWLAGTRVATSATGVKTYEAFVGPQNGVLTGTALAVNGTYTEYHKIGPQMSGGPNAPYGLSVANPRSNMAWNFTPLKTIEAGKIVFESADGVTRITYFAEPGNGVGSWVETTRNGTTTKTEYHFKPVN